jgi:hypothetical protein
MRAIDPTQRAVSICISLPLPLLTAVREEADERRTNVSAVIRDALADAGVKAE